MKTNTKLSRKRIYYLIEENPETNDFHIQPILIKKQEKRKVNFVYLDKTRKGFCDILDIYENLESAFKNYIYSIYTDSGLEYSPKVKKELFSNIKKYFLDSQFQYELFFIIFLEKQAKKIDFFTMKEYPNE